MRRALLLTAVLAAIWTPAALAQESIFSDDLTVLPEPVRATRDAMLAAARAADLAGLQAIIDKQGSPIQLGFGGAETAEEFAKGNSETGDGLDVLADLIDILEAPYAKVPDGNGSHFYVWPFLSDVMDLGALTDPQKVVAYQLVSPSVLPDLIDFGGWIAMRTIVNEDGSWGAWVLGD